MTNKQFRTLIRWVHIIGGSLIFAYIYSSTLNSWALFDALVEFGIIPILGLSGLALWQQPRLLKWLRRSQTNAS